VHHYIVEASEKRKIRNAFGLYLNPELARQVSERPEMLRLGGEKRVLTVLFSDIRGFTSISERLDPSALVELLNVYLGKMTDVVFANEGTLDKYIGDAIMAIWGAPIPHDDHAARASRAAVGMVECLEKLHTEFDARGWPRLETGIGLHTGEMIVGNMGSVRRLSYTVMGDNVNLGSRLEGLTKYYHTRIIASEDTVRAAGDGIVAREIDLVRVKARRSPCASSTCSVVVGNGSGMRARCFARCSPTPGCVSRAALARSARVVSARFTRSFPKTGRRSSTSSAAASCFHAPPRTSGTALTVMETK
jgi:adenylate cyclase